MSGRLIILPKKSYCPWNPQNVERVLRDEREHAEAAAKEQQRQQEEASRLRMEALKGTKTTQKPNAEHVNLFAREEKESLERVVRGGGEPKKNSGIKPLYLGQSAQDSKTAFDLRQDETKDSFMQSKDAKLKNSMDPMKEFQSRFEDEISTNKKNSDEADDNKAEVVGRQRSEHTLEKRSKSKRKTKPSKRDKSCRDSSSSSEDDESYRKSRKRRRKHKKSHRRNRSSSRSEKRNEDEDSGKDPWEDARKRRAEREAREQERQQSLLVESSQPRNDRRYNNQFNPRFSRRHR